MHLRQSTLTGLSACLFVGFVVVLFMELYRNTTRTGPLLWIAGVLLVATVGSWIAATRAGTPDA